MSVNQYLFMGDDVMLWNYSVKNFCSFYDEAEFSLAAPNTKVKNRFPDNYTATFCDINLLKTAVIVGENAGGKSNFITSLKFLKSLFSDVTNTQTYKRFVNYANLNQEDIFKCDTAQEFNLDVIISNEAIYSYHLIIDYIGIIEEDLYVSRRRNRVKKKIFSVRREDIMKEENKIDDEELHFNITYEFDAPEIEDSLGNSLLEGNSAKTLGLFVTKLAILGNNYAVNLVDWVNNKLYPEAIDLNYDIYKALKKEQDDIRILNDYKFLEILRMVDYSIIGIEIDEEKPYSDTKIIRKAKDDKTFVRELKYDSTGVKEFFAWSVQVYRVVYENKVVFADEMDRVLNPILSERVVSYINGKKHFGQFIFTSHNILHLDLKNAMKEQIYFITKDRDTLNSELYSLSDFPEVRYETTKIYEFYMKGILGGTAFE